MKGRPYPGKAYKAPYCGRGSHLYEDFGQRPPTCKDCGHVLGGRVKR